MQPNHATMRTHAHANMQTCKQQTHATMQHTVWSRSSSQECTARTTALVSMGRCGCRKGKHASPVEELLTVVALQASCGQTIQLQLMPQVHRRNMINAQGKSELSCQLLVRSTRVATELKDLFSDLSGCHVERARYDLLQHCKNCGWRC
eukprot:1790484-Prymnesium_polylepis.2